MKDRYAFTMIELIFVIVIMGVLAKFGVEFLAQAYNNFILSKTNNELQAKSAMAVESIASRLHYRIKDSVIARDPNVAGYQSLPSSTYGDDARVLEWVASDIEGFRGNSLPLWSGIIDLNASTATILNSPKTNTTRLNEQIQILSHESGTTINDAALYFVGSNSDINGYGWGGAIIDQNLAMHPVRSATEIDDFVPIRGDNGVDNSFDGVEVHEFYQLAWTAYAVVHSENGDLNLHYDYQPWKGDNYLLKANGAATKKNLIMQNVSTFRFKAIGSVVKIQVCVKSDIIDGNEDGGYSLCKEKTIF